MSVTRITEKLAHDVAAFVTAFEKQGKAPSYPHRIEFRYEEAVQQFPELFKTATMVSHTMTSLRNYGLAQHIQRGSSLRDNIWDFNVLFAVIGNGTLKSIIEKGPVNKEPAYRKSPKNGKRQHTKSLNARKEEEAKKAKQQKQLVTVAAAPAMELVSSAPRITSQDIEKILQYYQGVSTEVLNGVNELIATLKSQNAPVEDHSEAIRAAELQLEQYQQEVQELRAQLQAHKERSLNKKGIFDESQRIMNVVESYLNTPGWNRSTENLLVGVSESVNAILKEVGAEQYALEPQKQ